MLVANSLDLWQKDTFFSAAEEVQQSADIMESAYRRWVREGVSPNNNKELHMALATAKWQLEEFEKAVRVSYRNYADEITMTRHKQFVTALENQILDVEAALRESFHAQGKKHLHWVTLDENERDDLALFLSGTSTGPSMKDGYANPASLTKDNGIQCYELSSNRDIQNLAQGCEASITCNIDANTLLQKDVDEIPRTRHDVGYVADGITSAKRTCNIKTLEILVDDGKRSITAADIDSTPKEKGLKPFFHRSRTILSYPQIRRFCGINQLLVRFGGWHRQAQSPLTFPFSFSIRFTLILMLTIFLVGKLFPCRFYFQLKKLNAIVQEDYLLNKLKGS